MSTIYRYEGEERIRKDIGKMVVDLGSLRRTADAMPGVSVSMLSQVMRGVLHPPPRLLEFLGYDRIVNVRYVRK